jgi:hypothetical protein
MNDVRVNLAHSHNRPRIAPGLGAQLPEERFTIALNGSMRIVFGKSKVQRTATIDR